MKITALATAILLANTAALSKAFIAVTLFDAVRVALHQNKTFLRLNLVKKMDSKHL